MVINKSHAEHVKNRLVNENHMKKILSFEGEGDKKENTMKASVATTTTGPIGPKDVNKAAITLSEASKKPSYIRAKDLETMMRKEPESEEKTGKPSFIKKRFEISRRDKPNPGMGLDKLKELSKTKSTVGISNPNDLDYLLWSDEPKEVATQLNFAQMLNFKNVDYVLSVQISSVLEAEDNNAKSCKFNRHIDYPLYRNIEHYTRLIPNAQNKEGPKGDMVKLINQNSHAIGLSESVAGKAVGMEMDLMTGKSATKMNAIRSKPVDMRQMALKAVLIKLQLTMAYALEDEELQFQSHQIQYMARVKTTTEALKNFPAKDIIIDITKLSDDQKVLLLTICSEWPSQRLIKDSEVDIYSSVIVDEENFELYHSQGEDEEIIVEGLKMNPKSFWSQCVQLFMNLGGLDDLVSVVRETRGLAPILNYNASTYGRGITMISAYPQSSCYYGLNVMGVQNRKYVAPTILESSTLVLLVDNMMLTLYLNNMLYLCENLGLGSKTLFPSMSGANSNKVMDVLACYNLTSGLPSCELMSMTCPWLGPIGRFHRSGISVLLDMINRVRNRQSHDLVCCSLNHKIPTKMVVSSVALVQGKQEVDVSKIMGFHSNLSSTGPTVKLLNWYCAISGDSLPCHGASLQGTKLRGDELPMLRKVHKYKGVFSIDRVIAITEYEPQRTSGGTLKQTFFHNPGYMEAQGEVKNGAKPVVYKTNSFTFSRPNSQSTAYKPQPEGAPSGNPNLDILNKILKDLDGQISNENVDAQKALTEKLRAGGMGMYMLEWMNMMKQVELAEANKEKSPGIDKNSTTNSLLAEGFEISDSSTFSTGSQTLLELPEYEPIDNEYTSGNCAIDALALAIPSMDKEEALSTIGLSVKDEWWLAADELSKVADAYGYNLLVIREGGLYPEMYRRKGQEGRKVATVYQTQNHFQAVREKPGKRVIKNTLTISVEPAPATEEGRKQMRNAIQRGQATRNCSIPPHLK
nr:MAG: hypothetical protein [Enontekio alphachrysovirus]